MNTMFPLMIYASHVGQSSVVVVVDEMFTHHRAIYVSDT